MQGQQGQMVSGRYVAPSWTQQLAQLGTAALGAYAGNQADERQTAMAQALRDRQAKSLSDYTQASKGKQAVEGGIYGPDNQLTTQTTADMYGPNMELNPQYRKVEAQAAQGPDFQKMMQIALDPYAHPILRSQAEEMLKGKVYKKGDVEYRTNMATGQREIVGQGAPDLPSDLETAVTLLGVPADSSKWTPQIRAAVDAKVNQLGKNKGTSFDFSNFLGKGVVGEVGGRGATGRCQVAGHPHVAADVSARLPPAAWAAVASHRLEHPHRTLAATGACLGWRDCLGCHRDRSQGAGQQRNPDKLLCSRPRQFGKRKRKGNPN
jgi:hypothetical protein